MEPAQDIKLYQFLPSQTFFPKEMIPSQVQLEYSQVNLFTERTHAHALRKVRQLNKLHGKNSFLRNKMRNQNSSCAISYTHC